jgi:hypothetical protein
MAILVVTGLTIGGPAGTASAQADQAAATTCSWDVFGKSSNCDDVDPWATTCADDRDAKRTATLSSDPAIRVYLYYSPSCRTVWASIMYWGSAQPGTCYVKVQRNSDNRALYDGVAKDPFVTVWVGETNMLYDADVTSYAWGYCEVNGRTYRGGTSSY